MRVLEIGDRLMTERVGHPIDALAGLPHRVLKQAIFASDLLVGPIVIALSIRQIRALFEHFIASAGWARGALNPLLASDPQLNSRGIAPFLATSLSATGQKKGQQQKPSHRTNLLTPSWELSQV